MSRSREVSDALLAALVALVDACIDLKIGGVTAAIEPTYSQRDGQRPAGCGAAKYLRVHKLARTSGEPGATTQGRARLMTADCWLRWCDALPSRRANPATANATAAPSADDVIAAKLGIRRAS